MALSDTNIALRGATAFPHLESGFPLTAASTVNSYRLALVDSDGKAAQATAGATSVVGVNMSEAAKVAGEIVNVGVGVVTVVADDVLVPGQPIKAGDGGRAIGFVNSDYSGDTILTTGNGIAFTNQPANDGVEIVSSSAADTTQSATVIGTTTGTDTVVVETVALNGTTPVSTVKVDWGQILAVKLSASCAGTITFREASADAAITTILTTVLSKGVEAVTDQQAYNVAPTIVCSGSGTKQIGLKGTDSAGATIYDSQALSGTTAQTMNSAFKRVTEVYTGDLESNRTVTVKIGAEDSVAKLVGKTLTAAAAQDALAGALIYP